MPITKIQEELLRKFVATFDLVCFYNEEPITVDQSIEIFNGKNLTKSGVDKRKELFRATLLPFLKDKSYPKNMLIDFGAYWSELTHGGSKMRFELEKTWEIKARLQRWHNNNFGKNTGAPPATVTNKAIKPNDLF